MPSHKYLDGSLLAELELPPSGPEMSLSRNYLLDAPLVSSIRRGKLVPEMRRFLDEAGIDRNIVRYCDVYINGQRIEREAWLSTELTDVDRVTLLPRIQGGRGGGKSIVSIIAQVAIIATAAIATWYVGGLGGTFLGLSSTTWGGIAGAGVMLGGSLLLGSLNRQQTPKLESGGGGEQTYVVESTRNTARLYESQEYVIGRIRTSPSFAAAWYSVYYGIPQYWLGLYQVSASNVQLEDLRAGTTSTGYFHDIDVRIHQGWKGEPLFYFDRRREEVQVGAKIFQHTAVLRESPKGIKAFTLQVHFPLGLFWARQKGGTEATGIILFYQWRKKGTAEWNTQYYTLNMEVLQTFTIGLRVDLPDAGPGDSYEIITGRLTADSDATKQAKDETVLSVIQYEYDEPAIVYQPGTEKTLIEVRIKATDQLSGAIDQLNCIASSYGLVPDGAGNWNKQLTSNVAALALGVMTDAARTKRPYPWELIDWREWEKYYWFCERYGWQYAAVRSDGAKTSVVVNDILAAGMGYLSRSRDGKVSVCWDDLDATYVDTVTPATAWAFEIRKEFPIYKVHGLRVTFPNRDKDWQLDTVTVYADGYNRDNAVNVIEYKIDEGNRGSTGVDNYPQAYKLARIKLAQMVHRQETVSWTTSWRSLDYHLGQKIAVSYDTYLVGSGNGLVLAYVDGNGATMGPDTPPDTLCYGVVLSDSVNMEAGKTYILRDTEKYSTTTWRVKTVVGSNDVFYFEYPIPLRTAPKFQMDVIVGESGRDAMVCTILSISRQADYTATITAVPSKGAELLASISGPIPPFDSQITYPSYYDKGKPHTPYIQSIRSDETCLIRIFGALVPRIGVSFYVQDKPGVTVDRVRGQIRLKDSGGEWQDTTSFPGNSGEIFFDGVEQGRTYEMRLQAVSTAGIASDWSIVAEEIVVGLSTPPDDIINAMLEDGYLKIKYDPPPDFEGYEVLMAYASDATPAMARPLFSGLQTSSSIFVGKNLNGDRTFFIYAVDIAGNRSLNPAAVRLQWEDAFNGNAVYTYDYRENGWPGRIEGGAPDEETGCLAATETTLFWQGDDMPHFEGGDNAPYWKPSSYLPMTYYFSVTIPDGAMGVAKHFLEKSITGQVLSIDYNVQDASKFWKRYSLDENVTYDDTAPFWQGGDDALFWGEPLWSPLPDYLPVTEGVITMRIRLAGGAEQGRICKLQSIFDYPDEEEGPTTMHLEAGWNLIPLSKTYREIKYKDITINETPGLDPVEIRQRFSEGRLELLPVDENGNPTEAEIRIYIRGY